MKASLTLLLGIVCATGPLVSIMSLVDNKAEEFGGQIARNRLRRPALSNPNSRPFPCATL